MEKFVLKKSINGKGEKKMKQLFPHCIQLCLNASLNLMNENEDLIWNNVDLTIDVAFNFMKNSGCEYVLRVFKYKDNYRLGGAVRFMDIRLRTYRNYMNLGMQLCRILKEDSFLYCNGDEALLDNNDNLLSWRSGEWLDEMIESMDDNELYTEPSYFLKRPDNIDEYEKRMNSGEIFIEFE